MDYFTNIFSGLRVQVTPKVGLALLWH